MWQLLDWTLRNFNLRHNLMAKLFRIFLVGLAIFRKTNGYVTLGGDRRTTELKGAPRSFVDNQFLYQRFEKMYGSDALKTAVASPTTLQKAVDATVQYSIEKNVSAIRITGCTSYDDGSILTSLVRGDKKLAAQSQLTPFVVSRKENHVCFLFKWLPEHLLETMKFSYPVPSALKVHQFVYKTVDKLARLESFSSIPARGSEFRLQITTFSGDISGALSSENLVATLKAYDLTVFQRFFWSGSQHVFAEQSLAADRFNYIDTLSIQLDHQRSKTWSKLSSLLESLQADEGSVGSLSVSDPCGFLGLKPKATKGRITLSVTHLLNHQNPQIGAACLSFMVAHLVHAPNSPIFHIAIASHEILLNNHARSIVQGSGVGSGLKFCEYTARGLLGHGQVVQMADTGVDVDSCYFRDKTGRVSPADATGESATFDESRRKIIQYVYFGQEGDTTDSIGGHGTHVAGTIAGNIPQSDMATGNGMYDGVAPGAKLAVMDLAVGSNEGLAIPDSADILYGSGHAAGARIHSNSWGSFFPTGDQGYYSSSDTDSYLFDHQDSTIFFAAGNQGDVAYAVSMQAQSKNTIAVGSSESTLNSDSIDNLAWYSSFGPAYDGRIKPDVVSPGDMLMSAKSMGDGSLTCETVGKTGTSQATPAAAGAAALVRQYLSDGALIGTNCFGQSCSPFTPSGVLIKAIMLHSGTPLARYHFGDSGRDQDMGSPPDEQQGYGRVTLKNVLPLPDAGDEYDFHLFVDDLVSLSSDDSNSYYIHVDDPSVPLKLTLSWYDPPNQDGISTPALLHDLDLQLVSPSQEQFLGNGQNSGHSGFDTLNNNEQIFVNSPESGDWIATVTARSLFAAESQAYAIVITLRGSVGDEAGISSPISAPAPGPIRTNDDYQQPGQDMRIKQPSRDSQPALAPLPETSNNDDYQQPGEEMKIKPPAIESTTKCSCPVCPAHILSVDPVGRDGDTLVVLDTANIIDKLKSTQPSVVPAASPLTSAPSPAPDPSAPLSTSRPKVNSTAVVIAPANVSTPIASADIDPTKALPVAANNATIDDTSMSNTTPIARDPSQLPAASFGPSLKPALVPEPIEMTSAQKKKQDHLEKQKVKQLAKAKQKTVKLDANEKKERIEVDNGTDDGKADAQHKDASLSNNFRARMVQ